MSAERLEFLQGTLEALHRLERQGLISSEWSTSDNNRRAKFYHLTAAGKKRLTNESSKWGQFVVAIARVMKPAGEEE